jgi:hypothetical protein
MVVTPLSFAASTLRSHDEQRDNRCEDDSPDACGSGAQRIRVRARRVGNHVVGPGGTTLYAAHALHRIHRGKG